MTPENERDALSELLSGVELPPANADQCEAIFSQTRGLLQQRRLIRQSLRIATLACCYILGVCSILAWQAIRPHDQIAAQPDRGTIEIKNPIPPEQPIVPTSPDSNLPEITHSVGPEPTEIAQSLPADNLTTFEKMRQAGDRQLNERGNLQGAIGCYRRALEFASDDDLQIVPERDSWLLIPLKKSRLETRKHVYKKS